MDQHDQLDALDDALHDPRLTVIDGHAVCLTCRTRIIPTAAVGVAATAIADHLDQCSPPSSQGSVAAPYGTA